MNFEGWNSIKEGKLEIPSPHLAQKCNPSSCIHPHTIIHITHITGHGPHGNNHFHHYGPHLNNPHGSPANSPSKKLVASSKPHFLISPSWTQCTRIHIYWSWTWTYPLWLFIYYCVYSILLLLLCSLCTLHGLPFKGCFVVINCPIW